jgi:hypothetical protein
MFLSPILFTGFVGIMAMAATIVGGRALIAYPFGYSTDWRLGVLLPRKPAPFQFRGTPIYPGYFFIPVVAVGLNYLVYLHHKSHSQDISLLDIIAALIVILEVAAIGFGTLFALILFFASDTWDLISEWWDDRTKGICRVVEFENKEN